MDEINLILMALTFLMGIWLMKSGVVGLLADANSDEVRKKVLASNPTLHMKNSEGKIVFTIKPNEKGYNYYLMQLRQGKTKASYYLESPARSEADQLEIDRLREEKGVLETLLIENGITLPSNAPEPYKAYSWKDETLEEHF